VPQSSLVYRFAAFELDPERLELRKCDRAVNLPTKSFDVLLYLVENRGRSVSRSELLSSLWPGVCVASGSLTQAIWAIREVVRDHTGDAAIIKTVRGLGYRFVAPVLIAHTGGTHFAVRSHAPRTLQERLGALPAETRALVLELAAELARAHVTPSMAALEASS
jgi:DNA-binding winged helix-turn-helix (wHTH) protein